MGSQCSSQGEDRSVAQPPAAGVPSPPDAALPGAKTDAAQPPIDAIAGQSLNNLDNASAALQNQADNPPDWLKKAEDGYERRVLTPRREGRGRSVVVVVLWSWSPSRKTSGPVLSLGRRGRRPRAGPSHVCTRSSRTPANRPRPRAPFHHRSDPPTGARRRRPCPRTRCGPYVKGRHVRLMFWCVRCGLTPLFHLRRFKPPPPPEPLEPHTSYSSAHANTYNPTLPSTCAHPNKYSSLFPSQTLRS